VEILHRRVGALVAELFLRMVRADVVRPVSSNTVPQSIPRNVLVFRDGHVAPLNEGIQQVVARVLPVGRPALGQPQFVAALILVVGRPLV